MMKKVVQFTLILVMYLSPLIFSSVKKYFTVHGQEQINLPECDGNPEARILFPEEDLAVVNTDTAHSVFCLKPGEYSNGASGNYYHITRSCSQSKKCYLRADDISQKPWKKTDNGQDNLNAVIGGLYIEGSHWIISNLVLRGPAGDGLFKPRNKTGKVEGVIS